MVDIQIKLLTESDEAQYFLHCEKAVRSGGKNGAPPYTPLGQETTFSSEDRKSIVSGWKIKPTKEEWNRIWGCFSGNQIVGSIMLKGASVKTKIHRVHLSIGIDGHRIRGKGIGSQLITEAVNWAKCQESIAWIDLSVFDTSPIATALYKKFGFEEYGRLKDHFRIEGKNFDHILMTLKICP